MEWWQSSANILIGAIVAIIGAIVGFLFTRLGAAQERKLRERDQLRNAVRGLLAEVEANLKLANERPGDALWPFPTDMWDVHKGYILDLPEDLQDNLHRLYVFIQRANALVQMNLTMPYGSQKYNEPYNRDRAEIAREAEAAINSLAEWLKASEN